MAVNDHTLDTAKRTAYYESPANPVLLPYSKLVIDNVEYIEMNAVSTREIPGEGGGGHYLPSTGKGSVTTEYRERRKGYRSPDVPQGITRANPPESEIHNSGWI